MSLSVIIAGLVTYAILTLVFGWIMSNDETDIDGYGSCLGLVGICIFAPLWIPVWLLKYWAGYWGDTDGYKYYKFCNHGKGEPKRKPREPLKWVEKPFH